MDVGFGDDIKGVYQTPIFFRICLIFFFFFLRKRNSADKYRRPHGKATIRQID